MFRVGLFCDQAGRDLVLLVGQKTFESRFEQFFTYGFGSNFGGANHRPSPISDRQ